MDLYERSDGQTDKGNNWSRRGLEADETDGVKKMDKQIVMSQFDVKARKRKP